MLDQKRLGVVRMTIEREPMVTTRWIPSHQFVIAMKRHRRRAVLVNICQDARYRPRCEPQEVQIRWVSQEGLCRGDGVEATAVVLQHALGSAREPAVVAKVATAVCAAMVGPVGNKRCVS